jgi:F0F1-type ATP synthase assembly protein I
MATPNKIDASRDQDRLYQQLALRIFVEFGAEIALPVVLFTWLGKRLDSIWGSAPWMLVAGFLLAFSITAAVVTRRAKQFGKEYESIGQEQKKEDKT